MLNLEYILGLGRLNFFLITIGSFLILYVIFTIPAYYIFTVKKYFPLYQKKEFRSHQITTEIKRSIVSILMFGVLSFPLFEGLKSGFLRVDFNFSTIRFLLEAGFLFLWNEVYFYIIHRSFHFKIFYKYHADHHYSHVPNPFSAYSFHWSEGLLLGAVMPVIMCFYDFQFYSLMTLPVMSIFLNVLGHSNAVFFSEKPMTSLLSFSKRHSQHHKIPHTNYGFFLPYFDILFKTSGTDSDK